MLRSLDVVVAAVVTEYTLDVMHAVEQMNHLYDCGVASQASWNIFSPMFVYGLRKLSS